MQIKMKLIEVHGINYTCQRDDFEWFDIFSAGGKVYSR